jgi:hypothetical protein
MSLRQRKLKSAQHESHGQGELFSPAPHELLGDRTRMLLLFSQNTGQKT